MKHKETLEISKHAWQMTQASKNATSENITLAIVRGDIKVERKELEKLVSLINASVEQGYHTTVNEFSRLVDNVLDSAVIDSKSKKE